MYKFAIVKAQTATSQQ